MADKVKEGLADLFDNRRKFTIETEDGVETSYYIGVPTADDVSAADWHHAKVYNRGLREGIFTATEMMEILKERNIIGDKYDEVLKELGQKLNDKLVEMEVETNRDKRVALAMEVAHVREQIFQWNQRMSSPLSSTCESIANDARTEFLTYKLIETEDGTKVWDSFEDYKTEKNVVLQTKARFEVMLWLEGVDSDFLSNVPENKVLSEYVDMESIAETAPSEELLDKVAAEEEKGKVVDEKESTSAKKKVKKTVKKPRKKRITKK